MADDRPPAEKMSDDIVCIVKRLDAWAREREHRTISWMSLDEIQLIVDALYCELRRAQERLAMAG